MRRSTRLSRQSDLGNLSAVDENSAFVANVKVDSPRASTESKRRSLRKSLIDVVAKPIEEDLMGKLESIEAEYNQKSQMLALEGEGWTEKKESETSDQTPERNDDRESKLRDLDGSATLRIPHRYERNPT